MDDEDFEQSIAGGKILATNETFTDAPQNSHIPQFVSDHGRLHYSHICAFLVLNVAYSYLKAF